MKDEDEVHACAYACTGTSQHGSTHAHLPVMPVTPRSSTLSSELLPAFLLAAAATGTLAGAALWEPPTAALLQPADRSMLMIMMAAVCLLVEGHLTGRDERQKSRERLERLQFKLLLQPTVSCSAHRVSLINQFISPLGSV